ncbi:MAG: DNA-directed RNA polymerase subunit K [Candidatus Methanomethyliaceae archaeon]|nr:DNA-directed RNA polymerase subunit K [Candidatus Methanomethyliaceae archaeon]MDW7971254.1 DNA-directed RNA polymerase subunit K [Nitrososphaerota archaeon]
MEQEKIIGPSRLTRFERARIISARALQISMGAPPLIMMAKSSPLEIAEEELKAGVLPITIRRRLPDGRYQDIPLKWLIKKEVQK